MGNERGETTRPGPRGWRRWGAAVGVLGLVTFACSSGDGEGSSAVTDASTTVASAPAAVGSGGGAGLRPCAEDRHGVIIDLGVVTYGAAEFVAWAEGETADMRPRPGAAELLRAYRERGYEVVYLTALPVDLRVEGDPRPIAEVIGEWQRRHGFPSGEGTVLHMWDRTVYDSVPAFRADTLLHLAVDGLALDYAYTDDENDVLAFRNGGIPADHIFTIQGEAGTPGTVGVLEDDWESHRARVVDPLPPACLP